MAKMKKFFSANIREISLVIVMIVIAIFVEYRSGGNFLTAENLSDMFTETSVLAICAVGMMFVMVTGGIDLSIGAIMALGAMAGCTVLKNNPGIPTIGVVVIAMAVGIVSGFFNGLLVSKLKILQIITNTRT